MQQPGLRPGGNRRTEPETKTLPQNTDAEFISRSNHKTPDFIIDGVEWELKSPTGTGKYNVQHQVKAADKQPSNVVFDARRSKMHMAKIRNEVQRHFRYTKPIKRLILIDKTKKMVELSK